MSWQEDLERLWARLPTVDPDDFGDLLGEVALIIDDPAVPADVRAFEYGCAYDSTGRSDLAISKYQQALDLGLAGYQGRRAKIQLASSLRNLGRSSESVRILAAESTSERDGLDDAVVVFCALALSDLGREREAVVALVHALAEHLPRYTASAHRYADALVAGKRPDGCQPG